MNILNNVINEQLTAALEYSEAVYWSKLYNNNTQLKAVSTVVADAFVGAIPEQDILALNRVIGLGVETAATENDINKILDFYNKLGVKRFFIQVSPFVRQESLPELLQQMGFTFYNNWSKLMRLSGQPLPEVQTKLNIRRVSIEEADLYGRIIAECFEWEGEQIREWLSACIGKPGYKHYFVTDNNSPVAAGALHILDKYASLAMAGTLPEYRHMGAQGLLMKTRIEDARRAGCEYIISETAEEKPDKPVASYRNMRRFGFEMAYLRPNWIYENAS